MRTAIDNAKLRYRITLAGALVLWIAVAASLIYTHNLLSTQAGMTAARRGQIETPLIGFAVVFVAYNAVMTWLKLRQIQRDISRSRNLQETQ